MLQTRFTMLQIHNATNITDSIVRCWAPIWIYHSNRNLCTSTKLIRESVDSLCRDGADAQLYAILKQKPYNFTTSTLKAYLSIQAYSLSGFVISKTHISGQKPRRTQLTQKCAVMKVPFCRILLVKTSLEPRLSVPG